MDDVAGKDDLLDAPFRRRVTGRRKSTQAANRARMLPKTMSVKGISIQQDLFLRGLTQVAFNLVHHFPEDMHFVRSNPID